MVCTHRQNYQVEKSWTSRKADLTLEQRTGFPHSRTALPAIPTEAPVSSQGVIPGGTPAALRGEGRRKYPWGHGEKAAPAQPAARQSCRMTGRSNGAHGSPNGGALPLTAGTERCRSPPRLNGTNLTEERGKKTPQNLVFFLSSLSPLSRGALAALRAPAGARDVRYSRCPGLAAGSLPPGRAQSRRRRPRAPPRAPPRGPVRHVRHSAGIGQRAPQGRDSPAGRGRGPFRLNSLGRQTKAPAAKLKCPRGHLSRGSGRGGVPRPPRTTAADCRPPPTPSADTHLARRPSPRALRTRLRLWTHKENGSRRAASGSGRAAAPGAETAGPEEEAAGREKSTTTTTHRPPFVGPARTSAQLCALRRPRRVPAAGSWRAADAAAYISAGSPCAVLGREEPGGETPSGASGERSTPREEAALGRRGSRPRPAGAESRDTSGGDSGTRPRRPQSVLLPLICSTASNLVYSFFPPRSWARPWKAVPCPSRGWALGS